MNSRNKRAEIAQETLKIIEDGFYIINGVRIDLAKGIAYAIDNTKVYEPNDFVLTVTETFSETHLELTNETTFAAAQRLVREGKKPCCLNFASAKNPGGGVLGGSQAQEEALSRSSALYACLKDQATYYETNRKFKSCIYTDHMIYAPLVPVFRDDNDQLLSEAYCTSVVTAPAINMGVIKTREAERIPEALDLMKVRITKLLTLCVSEGEKDLVLGAWGCGVFQNDATWMAESFKEILNSELFKGAFNSIVFAVPNSGRVGEKNYLAFQEVFN